MVIYVIFPFPFVLPGGCNCSRNDNMTLVLLHLVQCLWSSAKRNTIARSRWLEMLYCSSTPLRLCSELAPDHVIRVEEKPQRSKVNLPVAQIKLLTLSHLLLLSLIRGRHLLSCPYFSSSFPRICLTAFICSPKGLNLRLL